MVRMSTSRRFLSAVADVYRPSVDVRLCVMLRLWDHINEQRKKLGLVPVAGF